MSSVKIATSVPSEQYKALEEARRRLGLKRSAVVQEALALWLAQRQSRDDVAQYLRGYMAQPEDADEGGAYVAAWADGMAAEDWS